MTSGPFPPLPSPTFITSFPFLFIPLPFCNYLSLRPRGGVIGNPNFQFGVRLRFDMAHIIWFQFHSGNVGFEREKREKFGSGGAGLDLRRGAAGG